MRTQRPWLSQKEEAQQICLQGMAASVFIETMILHIHPNMAHKAEGGFLFWSLEPDSVAKSFPNSCLLCQKCTNGTQLSASDTRMHKDPRYGFL